MRVSFEQTSSFSRGKILRALPILPSRNMREAERRQALGCSGTLKRARAQARRRFNAAPCIPRRSAYAVRAPGMLASRRSTAAIYWPPSPPWPHLRALHMSGALRRSMGAFARSARSGGRAVLPDASRGFACKATRRTPRPVPLMRCLAKSTLGGRNATTIVLDQHQSKQNRTLSYVCLA
jgi:hypothetical protein